MNNNKSLEIRSSRGTIYRLERQRETGNAYVCFVKDVEKNGKSFPILANLFQNVQKLRSNYDEISLSFIYHPDSDSLQILLMRVGNTREFLHQRGTVSSSYNINDAETLLETREEAVDLLVGIRNKTLVHDYVINKNSFWNIGKYLSTFIFVLVITIIACGFFLT